MRKPSRGVELDDIISNQIVGDDPAVITLVMKIHLALEAIIIEMIRTFDNRQRIYRLTFPEKLSCLMDRRFISDHDRQAFEAINDFRNDFAHIFGYKVTLAEGLELARKLEGLGVDFSDSIGHYSEEDATRYYGGLQGVLEEVGWCTLVHAAHLLNEAGGRDVMSAYRQDSVL